MTQVDILFSTWYEGFSHSSGSRIGLKIHWMKDKNVRITAMFLPMQTRQANPTKNTTKGKKWSKIGKIGYKSDWPQIYITTSPCQAWFLDQISFQLEHICLMNLGHNLTCDTLPHLEECQCPYWLLNLTQPHEDLLLNSLSHSLDAPCWSSACSSLSYSLNHQDIL